LLRLPGSPSPWRCRLLATCYILAGARYFGIKPTLGWSIQGDLGPIPESGRSGSKEIDEAVWDGIVGVKGRYAFGDERRWYVP